MAYEPQMDGLITDGGTGFNVYANGPIDENTPVIFAYAGQSEDANSAKQDVLTAMDQSGTNALVVTINGYSPTEACSALQAVSQMPEYKGVVDFQNVSAYGVSYGAPQAVMLASESLNPDANYSFKVTDVVAGDGGAMFEQYSSTIVPDLDNLAAAGVKLNITCEENAEKANYFAKHYSQQGGNVTVMELNNKDVVGTENAHSYLCHDTIEKSEYWQGKRDLNNPGGDSDVTVYKYENGEKKLVDQNDASVPKQDNSDEKTSKSKESVNDKDSDSILVQYEFLRNSLDGLNSVVSSSHILQSGNIGSSTNDSSTFAAANSAFNSYASMTGSFLSSLGNSFNIINSIAQSISALDASLANDASNLMYFDSICNQDLSGMSDFFSNNNFDNIPILFDFSDSDGNIKITKDELIAALSDGNQMIGTLLQDVVDNNKIKQQIDAFVNNSNNYLRGSEWDKVREKMNYYSDICSKKSEYANKLVDRIKSAYTNLLNYMEEFDDLDSSMIDEVIEKIEEIDESIASLNNQLASTPPTTTNYEYDEKGDVIGSYTIDNSDLIAAINDQLEVQNIVKEILVKLREKIEGLGNADKSAAEEITGAEETDGKTVADAIEDASTGGSVSTPSVGGTESSSPIDGSGEISTPSQQEEETASKDSPSEAEASNTQPQQEEETASMDSPSEVEASNTQQPAVPSSSGSGENGEQPADSGSVQQDVGISQYDSITTSSDKLVYNVDNECKLIINNDGDNVTGMGYLYDFGNQENAIKMLDSLKQKYGSMDGISSITVNDRYVNIMFSPDFYQDKNIEYFKNAFSNYNLI